MKRKRAVFVHHTQNGGILKRRSSTKFQSVKCKTILKQFHIKQLEIEIKILHSSVDKFIKESIFLHRLQFKPKVPFDLLKEHTTSLGVINKMYAD